MTGPAETRESLSGEPFCMTYGDGVADVNIGALTAYDESHGADATVTAVQPVGRFGALRSGSRARLPRKVER
jgi:glucose-1-phosphate cytidylyltransferase